MFLDAALKELSELTKSEGSRTQDELIRRLKVSLQTIKGPNEELPLLDQLDAAYKARHLTRLRLSGVKLDRDTLLQVASDSLLGVKLLDVEPELIESRAEALFKSSKVKAGDTLMIAGSKENIQILEAIARICISAGVNFMIDIENAKLTAALLNGSDQRGRHALANEKTLNHVMQPKVEARSAPASDVEFDQDATGFFYGR